MLHAKLITVIDECKHKMCMMKFRTNWNYRQISRSHSLPTLQLLHETTAEDLPKTVLAGTDSLFSQKDT